MDIENVDVPQIYESQPSLTSELSQESSISDIEAESTVKDVRQTRWILLALCIIFVIPATLLTYRAIKGITRKSIADYYIPQPFTENNIFSSVTFVNELEVLLIRPNRADAKIYLCKLKSAICRSWNGIRPSGV